MQALRGFGVGQGVATEDIKHPSDHALLPFEGTAGGGNVLDLQTRTRDEDEAGVVAGSL